MKQRAKKYIVDNLKMIKNDYKKPLAFSDSLKANKVDYKL